jgi:hypothetical protein
VPVAVAEGMDCPEVLVVMLRPQWLHVRFLSPAVPSLQTSSSDVGWTSSVESDLPQSITPGTDDPAGLEEPPESAGGLPTGELGEVTAEAEKGAELGVAEAPEPVAWHAVMKADPRTAQMASDIREFRVMSPKATSKSCDEIELSAAE